MGRQFREWKERKNWTRYLLLNSGKWNRTMHSFQCWPYDVYVCIKWSVLCDCIRQDCNCSLHTFLK